MLHKYYITFIPGHSGKWVEWLTFDAKHLSMSEKYIKENN